MSSGTLVFDYGTSTGLPKMNSEVAEEGQREPMNLTFVAEVTWLYIGEKDFPGSPDVDHYSVEMAQCGENLNQTGEVG